MDTTLQEKFPQRLQICGHEQTNPAFSDIERKIIAINSPADNAIVKDLSMLALRAFATKLYDRASARYGNAAKGDTNSETNIKLLTEDLMRNGLLRIKEVSFILEEGLSGSYDKEDVRHFSSSRFCKWIKTYLEEQKLAVMKKKAQFDHQNLTPPTPQEQEIKTRHETFFGELAQKVEKGELPQNFAGFDAIYEECERLGVFDPLDMEEKKIIAQACEEYTGYAGDKLKSFSRKVAYLYVLHQAAMVSYTMRELIKHVAGHDKSLSGYLQDLAKTRLAEYEQYKSENEFQ